jgi:hypothetical protein
MWPGRPSMKPVLHGTFGSVESDVFVWGLNGLNCLAQGTTGESKLSIYNGCAFISTEPYHYLLTRDSLLFFLRHFF